MSSTTTGTGAPEGCRPADVTPVRIEASALESTAPEYLRDLKCDLASSGYQPASLAATATFDVDCSLATQAEADRVRALVRAASFLGAGRVDLRVSVDAPEEKVAPALSALSERAEREGVRLDVVRT